MADRVDVTVIGGGPCGLFASFYAGLRGMSVRVIDSLPELGGQLTALYPEKYVYDVAGFPKALAKDLAKSFAEQGTQFGPDLVLGQSAEKLTKDSDGYVLGSSLGQEFPTRTVIIAAGAGAFSPTKLGVEREEHFEGKGLFYGVKEKAVFADKNLVIVGGGDSAFDWALNLMPVAKQIRLVHRRDQFKAHEDSVRQVQESPIEMSLWCTVCELHGEDSLEGLTLLNSQTKEKERVDADAVIVNVGFKSSLGPLRDWGLDIDKTQIRVDRRFETSLPGVYAVGDVCTYEGKLKLIATGVGEATMAVCYAKQHIDPGAKLFPGHSSELDLSAPGGR